MSLKNAGCIIKTSISSDNLKSFFMGSVLILIEPSRSFIWSQNSRIFSRGDYLRAGIIKTSYLWLRALLECGYYSREGLIWGNTVCSYQILCSWSIREKKTKHFELFVKKTKHLKTTWRGYKLWEIMKKYFAWNIRHLVDELFVLSTKQASVLYWRLSEFKRLGKGFHWKAKKKTNVLGLKLVLLKIL